MKNTAALLLLTSIATIQSLELHGFYDLRAGTRLHTNETQSRDILRELRAQLDFTEYKDDYTLTFRGDFVFDDIYEDQSEIRLNTGEGWFDLRELNFMLFPKDWMDVKVGRQILTWGTGDLLFLNDLFPKDWNSFFAGRDTEYLKAPSDAVKFSIFDDKVNADIVWTPSFDSDRYISGDRISYYNALTGNITGQNGVIQTDTPGGSLNEGELALRLYKNLNGREYAFYAYNGFWKSPGGWNPLTANATFPKLQVYGASVRGNLNGGIANMEFALYNSKDDNTGTNPNVPNDEIRFLLGYEKEAAKNLTASMQLYLEHMQDYSEYRKYSSQKDKNRVVTTLRLTKTTHQQNRILSLFTFYSPTDQDGYIRPSISWKNSDQLTLELGANIFFKDDSSSFFGQFYESSNVYAAMRYNF
jgi:hypothetical protein